MLVVCDLLASTGTRTVLCYSSTVVERGGLVSSRTCGAVATLQSARSLVIGFR